MNKPKAEMSLQHQHQEKKDLRPRCPTCDMILPQHRKWCITPVVEGEKTMETREIKGEANVPLEASEQ